jgi:hypothetical protein
MIRRSADFICQKWTSVIPATALSARVARGPGFHRRIEFAQLPFCIGVPNLTTGSDVTAWS